MDPSIAQRKSKFSIWCEMFEKEDLKILEYLEDIKYWHTHGFFQDLNTKVACPLMENLVDTFDMENDNMPRSTLNFGHTDEILLFLSLLGLNQDEISLKHNNFERAKSRKYR